MSIKILVDYMNNGLDFISIDQNYINEVICTMNDGRIKSVIEICLIRLKNGEGLFPDEVRNIFTSMILDENYKLEILWDKKYNFQPTLSIYDVTDIIDYSDIKFDNELYLAQNQLSEYIYDYL